MCCALKFTEREKEFSNNVFKFFLQGGGGFSCHRGRGGVGRPSIKGLTLSNTGLETGR